MLSDRYIVREIAFVRALSMLMKPLHRRIELGHWRDGRREGDSAEQHPEGGTGRDHGMPLISHLRPTPC